MRKSIRGGHSQRGTMSLTRTELLELSSRASTLLERIASASSPPRPGEESDLAEERLGRWRATVANEDPAAFDAYLRWSGWTRDQARSAMHPRAWANDTDLPDWTGWLAEGVRDAEAVAAREETLAVLRADRAVASAQPLPFEECLLPFVREARRRLAARCPHLDLVTNDALAALERDLLAKLSRAAEQTLFAEFAAFRAKSKVALQMLVGALSNRSRAYEDFVTRMLESELSAVLLRYPVLARLLAQRLEFWTDASAELLVRLAADAGELAEVFHGGNALGSVTRVDTGLSDPHQRGRQVAILHFAAGVSVVYKPRDTRLEMAWSALLGALSTSMPDLPLRQLRHLPRHGYGWVEAAMHAPCATAGEVERFYERAGMLLCLAYLLGGTDLHSGNLLACGEHPVLVDLEALLVPRIEGHIDEMATFGSPTGPVERSATWESVLRTGLLPVPHVGPGGVMFLEGGLATRQVPTSIPMHVITHVNTDRMSRAATSIPAQPPRNVAVLDGAPVGAEQCAPAVTRGFRRMYALIASRRDELLAPGGPIARFAGLPARVVLRDTAVYGALLRRVRHPQFLTDGAEHGMALETLKSVRTPRPTRPRQWDAWMAEQAQLVVDDVPIFWVTSDGVAVRSVEGTCVEHGASEPAYDRAVARIAALGDDDLSSQLHFVRVSLQVLDDQRRRVDSANDDGLSTPSTFVAEAASIADSMLGLALDRDDHLAWVGLFRDRPPTPSRLRSLGWALYDGHVGVALFFAALARISGASTYRRGVERILRPLIATLSDPAARGRLAEEIGIGAGTGMGGIAYALTRAGQWLDDSRLLRAAGDAARAIETRLIGRDRTFDLVSGSAGAIVGLLAVHGAAPASDLLARAEACGRQLLRHQRLRGAAESRGWRAPLGATAGFAHGAPGIAYALLRLFEATGRDTYRGAARAALAFEPSASLLGTAPATEWSWCHGVTGLGLARLGALEAFGTDEAREELDAVLDAASEAAVRGNDHVCCGTLGRTDLLLDAARRLDRPALTPKAHAIAREVITRAKRHSTYSLTAGQGYAPMFFQGTAGIGYQLLRLSDPTTLPSTLIWE